MGSSEYGSEGEHLTSKAQVSATVGTSLTLLAHSLGFISCMCQQLRGLVVKRAVTNIRIDNRARSTVQCPAAVTGKEALLVTKANKTLESSSIRW
jgi:hypothetical protein